MDWQARVDEALTRTEARGVSPLRAVPLDMIATAVRDELGADAGTSDAEIDAALRVIASRNGFPDPVILR